MMMMRVKPPWEEHYSFTSVCVRVFVCVCVALLFFEEVKRLKKMDDICCAWRIFTRVNGEEMGRISRNEETDRGDTYLHLNTDASPLALLPNVWSSDS